MIIKTLQRSFAGGQIAPELHGRLDLTKFQTGLALCRNFWTLPHGPAQNRPGLAYVLETKYSTLRSRLIPFSFNAEQTFALEFGNGYIRFHTQGGTLVEAGLVVTGITQANPGVVSFTGTAPAEGKAVFLSGIVGMTPLNGRWVKATGVTAGTFNLTDFADANINTSSYPAFVASGAPLAAVAYEVGTTYLEAHLFGLHYVQSSDVLTIVHQSYAPSELRRLGATNWTLTPISFVPAIAAPAAPTVTPTGSGGTPVTHTYVTTALAGGTLEESLPSASANASLDLTIAANTMAITPAAVAGAVRYSVYKLFNGLFGYIGQTDGTALTDNNITPDMTKTPPNSSNPFATDFPGAVTYYEQRRVFAGTPLKPQNIWFTRSGTESNLSYSIPTRDDDAITLRVAAREANPIRHLVPLTSLAMLTAGGEWKIAPQNSDVLTPASAQPKQFANEGANHVQPVLTGRALIYPQATGGRVREIKYTWEANDFVSNDICLMAPDLFDRYNIVDIAYVRAPHKMVFAVRSDGVLLGLTYVPEHEVVAWHRHDTDGFFESVCAVREGNEDALYCIVKRTLNGRQVRAVERMSTRLFANLAASFFVDCGATYNGAPATTIGGLWHLVGETVSVLADGAVQPQQVVGAAGTITLEQASSVVHIGLSITSQLQTLPLALEGAQAGGQGVRTNVNEAQLRVNESSGIFVGPEFDDLFAPLIEFKQRTDEPFGSPPDLKSGIASINVMPQWDDDTRICIQQNDPLPLTIQSMTLNVAVGG